MKGVDVKKLLATVVFVTLTFTSGMASADVVTPFGDTTGTGPWDLSSTSTTYSGLDVALTTPITFSTLATLSLTFTDISGGADGGSPRLELYTSGSDYFTVYIGTPPNFNDNNPATFTTSFSGTNLNNGTNNSSFQLSNTYQTLSSLEATYGSDLINDVQLQVDGGWAANGTQELVVNSLDINGTNYNTSATPLPPTLPLFAAGIGCLGLFGWRRNRKNTAAIAAA
jgi:hypothetical protein